MAARRSRAKPKVIVGGRCGRAGASRRGSPHRQDHRQRPSRRDLPLRRFEPEADVRIACDRRLSKPDPLGSRALVHRRRAICPGGRSSEQHGDGAQGLPGPLRAASQYPSDRRRQRGSKGGRASLRERTEIVLRRATSSIRPGRCSMWCCSASGPMAIPPRYFRDIPRWRRPGAGSPTCPRRMSSRSCRGSR